MKEIFVLCSVFAPCYIIFAKIFFATSSLPTSYPVKIMVAAENNHSSRSKDHGLYSNNGMTNGSSNDKIRILMFPRKKIIFLVALVLANLSIISILITNVWPSSSNTIMSGMESLLSPQEQKQRQREARALQGDRSWQWLEQWPVSTTESIEELRERLPPSIWTTAGSNANPEVVKHVHRLLSVENKMDAARLCGKFLYSSLSRAVTVQGLGGVKETFVATGDIDDMWVRDSAVQIGIYIGRIQEQPFLRSIIEGAIRRQAFNILQDPYANSYSKKWRDPRALGLHDQSLGRGGFVATRNYELDSGAYFLTQLYDYYVMTAPTHLNHIYKPHQILDDPTIVDAVMLMIDTWIVEQNHEEKSPYRYSELRRHGKGPKTAYTGMSWSGFRPSDDPCTYGYHVPSNIFAAAALERTIELNRRIWKFNFLHEKATNLLRDIERGIQNYGVMEVPKNQNPWRRQPLRGKDGNEENSGTVQDTEMVYVYEVDGLGGVKGGFDDANIPSLLSIPLLGWTGYDKQVYKNTRNRLLSNSTNNYYFEGTELKGVGSPHTPYRYVWPLGFSMQALTEEGEPEDVAKSFAFQILQSLVSACRDAMHESVNVDGCKYSFTRHWFEWANALFVVLVETGLGMRCDKLGTETILNDTFSTYGHFYSGVSPLIQHDVNKQATRTNPR